MQFTPEILQLAALRQSRGIQLDTIADQTKISVYYLRAIENLDFAKLPGGVYRDSFLIQYAHAINEDLAEELRLKLKKAAREEAEAKAKVASQSGLKRSVKEIIARGAALAFLLQVGGTAFGNDAAEPAAIGEKDPRLASLKRFFARHKCPIQELMTDFLAAADRYGLDWRLLPSIAFLESSGGKYLEGQNLVGWGSGRAKFKTAKEGIFHVANRLACSPIYVGKDVKSKLRIYNPAREDYAARVIAVMEQMHPTIVEGSLVASR